MFRQDKRIKRTASPQGQEKSVLAHLFALDTKLYKAISNGLIDLFLNGYKLIKYIIVNTIDLIKKSNQFVKTILLASINWAMQFKLVAATVNVAIQLGKIMLTIFSNLSIRFKSFVVNTVPITVFVPVAKILPIGDWLKYERPDPDFSGSSLSRALIEEDCSLFDGLLQVCSEEALHRYILRSDCHPPLQNAAFHQKGDTTALKKILEAIKPEKRLWILTRLTFNENPLVCSLVRGDYANRRCEVVMNALPQQDKIHFMNQISTYTGSSPIMLQAGGGETWKDIKTFIDHYPKEHLLDYLNIKNNRNETFLTEAVSFRRTNYLEELFELIPEQIRPAYFAKHHQGLKALLYAKAYLRRCGHQIEILERQGIKLPPELDRLSRQELKQNLTTIFERLDGIGGNNEPEESGKFRVSEWVVRENFKNKHGQYPLEVLKLDKPDPDLSEIKSAYKKLMLFSHPDKNKDSTESTVNSQLINEAYGVYTKAEVRKSYQKS